MKAAVLREIGKPMMIEEVAVAEPGPREVLVRVKAVGLCHSDLHVIDGHLPAALPIVLGHEAAGIVERVGSDVTNVKPGDHVIASLVFHCGHCAHCVSGHPNRCMPPEARRGAGEAPRLTANGQPLEQFCGTGSFAEFMLVHDSGCVPIRKDVPFDCACLISCGVTTGFGAATRTAQVRPGETVAVIGCGGVGLAAVNGAAVAGARRIIAIDRLPMKLEMAKQFGATDTVDASQVDAVEAVLAMTGNWGVDHAIEAIGLPVTAAQAYKMLARGGTATIAGVISPGDNIEVPGLTLTIGERRLQGSYMGSVRPPIDVPNYVDLFMQGKMKVAELISQRIPLERINEAFDELARGSVLRSVIVFD